MILGVLLPIIAWAEPLPEPRTVAFAADLRVFSGDDESIDELRRAIEEGAMREWRAQDLPLTVLSSQELTNTIVDASLYTGTLALARQWAEMGVRDFKRVQLQEAVEHLERSLQNFYTISHDLVAPEELSEILMYLALSYLEDGTNVVRPLEILQEMVRRDPSRRLERGYYPDFIIQYYVSARDSLWRELRRDGPPIEESRRIAELVDADYVFHGYAVPIDEGIVELVAYLYNREEDNFFPAERLLIDDLDAAHLREGFSRLASRLAACLVEPAPADDINPIAPGGTSRLSLRVGMHYGSFLQVPSPLKNPFGNYGVGLGLGWTITSEFQLVGEFQIYNSIRDYDGVLRDDFTTLRTMMGGQLGRGLGPVYLGVTMAMELASFGPMRVFTDPSCIPTPELCPGDAGTATFSDTGLHLGVQLRPRISWLISNSFELSTSVGVGYYFAPLSDRLLNFPVTTEMGIRYLF